MLGVILGVWCCVLRCWGGVCEFGVPGLSPLLVVLLLYFSFFAFLINALIIQKNKKYGGTFGSATIRTLSKREERNGLHIQEIEYKT